MKRLIPVFFTVVSTALSGCAASPENHAASYILPAQFQTYTCDELSAEIERIQVRVSQLTGKSSVKTPNNDNKWALGTDLSLSWTALFALSGSKEQEAEYAQLKSQYDAIQYWASAKKCPGIVLPVDQLPEFDPNLVEEFKSNRTISQ
jgi:hypothetical protein